MVKKKINAVSFMAFAKGKESKEVTIKRYMGVGAVKILAINPAAAELNKIYGRTDNQLTDQEPVYLSDVEVENAAGEKVKVKQLRLSFITKTNPNTETNNGIEAILPVNFFLTQTYITSNKPGQPAKIKVIDKYGNTSWVTKEELEAQKIPEVTYKKGKHAGETFRAQLFAPYRACYRGEEELIKFIKEYLVIPDTHTWNGKDELFIAKTDPKQLEECECSLDNIKALFEGNIKEIKEIISFRPEQEVKFLFGVRKANNGALYQTALTSCPVRLETTAERTEKILSRQLENDKQQGRHPSETYEACPLKVFEASATSYSEKKEDDEDPFAQPAQAAPQAEASVPLDSDPFAGNTAPDDMPF